MKLVRNKSNLLGIYLLPEGESVTLDPTGLHAGSLHAVDVTDSHYELISGVPEPEVWAGGALAWDGGWSVVDQPRIEETLAQRAAVEREKAKAARTAAVAAITVTTAAGHTFDGDETSQARMSRAILVLSTGAAASVPWVLADNTVIQASAAELTEALALAGAEQASLWVLP